MAELLKHRYNRAFLMRLAAAIAAHERRFDADAFVRATLARDWNRLELKQRMRRIAETLHDRLPGDYREQLAVLRAIAPQFEGLTAMLFPDFVEAFGVDDFDASMPALEHFTPYSTSEFAVRPFIVRYGDRAMATLQRWTRHPSEHVRRLASEGCRPRLPWAMALPAFKRDPAPVLPILDALKDDPSEYVRRSVANNLNDIAKDHPDVVLEVAKRWLARRSDGAASAAAAQNGKRTAIEALVKHACRTLLKRGDPRALTLFGHDHGVDVRVGGFRLAAKSLPIGKRLDFSFWLELAQQDAASLRLEYAVDFVKSAGTTSRKVFKIGERHFQSGVRATFERSHRFEDFTTRKHYPGRHRIAILVNGVERCARDLTLTR